MKVRKTKKAQKNWIDELERRIAGQERVIGRLREDAEAERKRMLRFLRDLHKGLGAVNGNNFKFLTDIMVERLAVFIAELEPEDDSR